MTVVYKYRIQPTVYIIHMPQGAIIRHVGEQDGEVCIWAEVDPSLPSTPRFFRPYATGEDFDFNPDRQVFIGTVFLYNGKLVYHVYEVVDWSEP